MTELKQIRTPEREAYREDFPVVGEYRWRIVRADDINWLVQDETGNEGITVLHEVEVPGKSVHDFICSWFDPKITFLDIGAHAGHYSLRAAKKGCKVIAVEANPETAGLLRFNRDLNQLQCTIWAFAAWDSVDTVEITVPNHGTLRNAEASVAAPLDFDRLSVTVMARPIDGMPLKRVDLVKMDVEGADIHAFQGAHELLVRCKPLIIHEDHTEVGIYSPKDIRAVYDRLHDEAGYDWCDIRDLGVVSDICKYVVGYTGEHAVDGHRWGSDSG